VRPAAKDVQVTEPLPQDDQSAEADRPASPANARKVWSSDELLGGQAEAVILHRGQEYRLRCTRQGKLILFK
jgi:hemin uptake protein HemP